MREIYSARLEKKLLLSSAAECYHFEFAFAGAAPDALAPGQFLSLLADDSAGKTYTRAYSIASAPYRRSGGEAAFDLCVNRVAGGFFSNLLCDMQQGDSVRCHGPHGLFTLRQPASSGLMIAAGTGIAPMRGFAQWLFPEDAPDRSEGRNYSLIYEAPREEELYYHSYLERLAARQENFEYVPVLRRPKEEENEGAGPTSMEKAIARTLIASSHGKPAGSMTANGPVDGYAYVCGLSEMVKAARVTLLKLGWPKPQILFERYD